MDMTKAISLFYPHPKENLSKTNKRITVHDFYLKSSEKIWKK